MQEMSLQDLRIATQEDDDLALLNTPLPVDGQVPSEKFQVRFNPIGP